MNVVTKYKNELRQNKAIEYAGLRFQPLRVSNYALYHSAKPSFELLQASLPPRLARLSWMPCLDELDRQYREETGKEAGYMAMALLVFATALDPDYMEKPTIKIDIMRNREGIFQRIAVQEDYNSVPVYLSCQQLSELRQIIAAQNRYSIPDEGWNLELIKAQEYLRALKSESTDLNISLEALVSSVAANIGCRSTEIWEWSIKEFEEIQDAIDRKLYFQIYKSAELSGAKFEGGSPYPTWKYSRDSLPTGSRKLEDLERSAGSMLQKLDKE